MRWPFLRFWLLMFLFRRGYRTGLERSRIWLATARAIAVPLAVIGQAVGRLLEHPPSARIRRRCWLLILSSQYKGPADRGPAGGLRVSADALSGALAWNLVLCVAALLLIIWVYRHEGRSTPARVMLGVLRGALAAFVLVLLNNPILTRIVTPHTAFGRRGARRSQPEHERA